MPKESSVERPKQRSLVTSCYCEDISLVLRRHRALSHGVTNRISTTPRGFDGVLQPGEADVASHETILRSLRCPGPPVLSVTPVPITVRTAVKGLSLLAGASGARPNGGHT